MKLGAFSTSLSVKDLVTSRDFYKKLGFEDFAGSLEMNYLILKNGDTVIGLFQGMFEGNLLTFNPGWDQNAENIEEFDDVRSIEKSLIENGIEIIREIDAPEEGPANFVVADPDGNVILIDQHR
jgi:catechol 2,3-dioxygenase-like lactoylglutathione lyase family enzyme